MLKAILERRVNRLYHIDVCEISTNYFKAVFTKDSAQYVYFFIHDGVVLQFVVKDMNAHHQLSDIFGDELLLAMDDRVEQMSLDLNFMYEFCFGDKLTCSYKELKDLSTYKIYTGKVEGIECSIEGIEYSIDLLYKDCVPMFSATFFLKFNLETLMFYSTGKFIYRGDIFIGEGRWMDFKEEFLKAYAANRMGKPLSELTMIDGLTLPMINY